VRSELGACLLCVATLAGCQAGGGIAGAVTGTTTAALTANPALGAAVGIGTEAVTDAAISAASQRWHLAEQDALAAAVGQMGEGETRPWRVRHALPFGDVAGEVRVLRVSETPLTSCKEVLFSTAPTAGDAAAARWFVTSACQQAEGWKWAAAEPSTGRWGSLH
jgi:hypothetical protein